MLAIIDPYPTNRSSNNSDKKVAEMELGTPHQAIVDFLFKVYLCVFSYETIFKYLTAANEWNAVAFFFIGIATG